MKPVYKRIIIALLLFAVAVFLSGYFLYQTYRDLGDDLVRRTALLIGDSVNEILGNATDKSLESLTNSEKRSLRRLMRSLTSEEGNIIHILLISDKMRILLSSDPSVEGREYTSAEELAKLQGDEPRVTPITWDERIRVVDVILPLKNSEGYVYSYLRLVLSQEQLQNFYGDLSVIFIPLVLVFALLISFTVFFISRAYTKPLESIEEMAANINAGDFSYRINYERKDEFTDTFSRIDKSLEKMSVLKEGYKKAEKRMHVLMQAIEESIIMFDAEGRITSYNESAVELFRCPVEMLFESHFKQIENMNRELKSLLEQARGEGRDVNAHEMTLWLPGGLDVLARVSTHVFRDEGEISAILLSIKDQKLLNELQRNLQRSMKFGVIANLASSISHEIKNPLSSMAIHAEILNVRLKDMELENKESIHKSLDVLQNEVKRLNRIINQFFNLARSKKADLIPISINAVIRDVVTLVQQQAIERNIRVESILDDNIEKVYGDADQLKQVFLNIILNGFQAIEHDGRVAVRTASRGGRVHVEIEDDGCGMTPDVQQRIFELYFTTKHDGGGIGMAICKNIIEAHDGTIRFNSAPQQGTTFVIELPNQDQTRSVMQLKSGQSTATV